MWRNYLYLLNKYGGDLDRATADELNWAARGEPKSSTAAFALRIAQAYYEGRKRSRDNETETTKTVSGSGDFPRSLF
jgi:hypothetical protein